jgi:hypothetical protein
MSQNGDVRPVITGMIHGGHAILDGAPGAAEAIETGSVPLSEVTQEPGIATADSAKAVEIVGLTDFDYLFTALLGDSSKHLPADTPEEVDQTVLALNELGAAMIDQEPPADLRNSPIPPVYTYWGQFVDHDMTAATDNDSKISIRDVPLPPLPPDEVRALLKNARNPALNLDSVYGDGPFAPPPPPDTIAVPYQTDRTKLQVGTLVPVNVGVRIPPVDDMDRDLPRRPDRAALIGDSRNDENLVVAQLHVAFLRFHNSAVNWVRANEPGRTGDEDVFNRARDLTRWAYQWLTVHDFLATVTKAGTVATALADTSDPLGLGSRPTPYMPLEFSVAAYRFGHSMVRGEYDWNRNFGRPGNNTQPNASFEQLFQFTGGGGFIGGLTRLPSNWPIQWDRFVDKDGLLEDRFARRIDTHLAFPLSTMVNQVTSQPATPVLPFDIRTLLKHLARRNLLRGFRLGLPTGQAVAVALGLTPLTAAQLTAGLDPAVSSALSSGGFGDRTPLWFYVLRESERNEQGNTLGDVGSRIVAETIIGQIRHDPDSYLRQPDWSPLDGVKLPNGSPILTISDFLRFAGVL